MPDKKEAVSKVKETVIANVMKPACSFAEAFTEGQSLWQRTQRKRFVRNDQSLLRQSPSENNLLFSSTPVSG